MGQYYQKILTKTLSPIIHLSGVQHLTKPIFSGRGNILMMHRVIPKSDRIRIHNHLSLEISPEHLENIILFFRRRNYDFIALDQISDWLTSNKPKGKRFVIFTFDDGYRDNLDYAYPVLKKHSVPFTIYITNSFPEKNAIIWWYLLEDLILKENYINYSFLTGRINQSCSGIQAKEKAFQSIRSHIMKMNEENLADELERFFQKYGFEGIYQSNELTLSWDDISDLANDHLVSIGSHTMNHFNLINLSDENVWSEIAESKRIIESKIRRNVLHFCYPLGQYGRREQEIVKKIGFTTATTIKTAGVFTDHSKHLYSLPRIQINAFTTEKVLDLHVNGFIPAILNRFRPVVY